MQSMKDNLFNHLENACHEMIPKHPRKYPPSEYNHPLPDSVIIQNFVKNTPYEKRKEGEEFAWWSKNVLQIETDKDWEYLV